MILDVQNQDLIMTKIMMNGIKQTTKLDCPYDFTSRCTMGRCDCKPIVENINNLDREEWINLFKNNSKEEILELLIKHKFPL